MKTLLTPRQMDVLRELLKGKSNKSIATTLNVTEGTVKMTLHMMYERTGTGNRTQLALMFREVRMDDVPHIDIQGGLTPTGRVC
jgi:DNA-binding NarL/FixJ family response regulator